MKPRVMTGLLLGVGRTDRRRTEDERVKASLRRKKRHYVEELCNTSRILNCLHTYSHVGLNHEELSQRLEERGVPEEGGWYTWGYFIKKE